MEFGRDGEVMFMLRNNRIFRSRASTGVDQIPILDRPSTHIYLNKVGELNIHEVGVVASLRLKLSGVITSRWIDLPIIESPSKHFAGTKITPITQGVKPLSGCHPVRSAPSHYLSDATRWGVGKFK